MDGGNVLEIRLKTRVIRAGSVMLKANSMTSIANLNWIENAGIINVSVCAMEQHGVQALQLSIRAMNQLIAGTVRWKVGMLEEIHISPTRLTV